MILHYAVFALFPLMMAFAATSDLVSMTIPNWVSLALVAGFLVAGPLIGLDLATFGLHLGAGFVVLLVAFGMFAAGWIGGGDAKLAAAAALWFGFADTLQFVTLTAVFGGVLTVALLVSRRALGAPLLRPDWVARLTQPTTGIPYGIAIAAAALAIYPKTGWLALAVGP